MSHPFRTRLNLEEFEGRLALSGTPVEPDPSFDSALTSTEVDALPYVSIDFSGTANAQGLVTQVDQISITIYLNDGTVSTTLVGFTPTTPAGLATLVGANLRAQGYNVDYNGPVLVIWGRGDAVVENVRLDYTHSSTLGANPNVYKLPDIRGQNGATGSAGLNFPTSSGQ